MNTHKEPKEKHSATDAGLFAFEVQRGFLTRKIDIEVVSEGGRKKRECHRRGTVGSLQDIPAFLRQGRLDD